MVKISPVSLDLLRLETSICSWMEKSKKLQVKIAKKPPEVDFDSSRFVFKLKPCIFFKVSFRSFWSWWIDKFEEKSKSSENRGESKTIRKAVPPLKKTWLLRGRL